MGVVPPPLKAARWKVALVRGIVNVLFGVLTRRQVEGLEHLPVEGPCLLVFNHLSNFDPPLLFTVIPRRDVTGLIAADYRRQPFHRFAVEAAGGLWLRRGASDRAALQAALALLERNWMVGIAPEGRRSPTGALIEGKPGAAFLAARANVPIVPVGITNAEQLAHALKRLRRITLTIRVGEPFRLPPLERENHKQQLQAFTDLLMGRIAALLPPAYRGVYAAQPDRELVALGPE